VDMVHARERDLICIGKCKHLFGSMTMHVFLLLHVTRRDLVILAARHTFDGHAADIHGTCSEIRSTLLCEEQLCTARSWNFLLSLARILV